LKNFALIGVAGFVAPRHLKAIHDTGHRLAAAVDPHDAAGILDRFFPEARFFTEIERFDRFLEKRRRGPAEDRIDYVGICSPNYLHDAHVRMALRAHSHAICEKPLVINPWNLDALEVIEAETGCRVHTVLQLRLLPSLIELREKILRSARQGPLDVCLTYVTRRGPWYDVSWKGSEEKSGGVAMNIGIHFFDLVLWLFGRVRENRVHLLGPRRMAGLLELERARVRWFSPWRDRSSGGIPGERALGLPVDHAGRAGAGVLRRVHRSAHAAVRGGARRTRIRHRRGAAVDRAGLCDSVGEGRGASGEGHHGWPGFRPEVSTGQGRQPVKVVSRSR